MPEAGHRRWGMSDWIRCSRWVFIGFPQGEATLYRRFLAASMLTVTLLATGFVVATQVYWARPLRLVGSDALCGQGAHLLTTYRI